MKNSLLPLILLSILSTSTFAHTERTSSTLTYTESYEYFKNENYDDYRKLSNWERRGMITQSLIRVVGSCVGSAAGSILSYIGSSVPGVSVVSSVLSQKVIEHNGHQTKMAERMFGDHEGKQIGIFATPLAAGGSISTFADFFISSFDILDGKLDDQGNNEYNTRSFQNAKIVYSVPTELTIALLDEDSMCAESMYEVMLLSEVSFEK